MAEFPEDGDEFERRFATEEACRAYWIEARWAGEPACARCGKQARVGRARWLPIRVLRTATVGVGAWMVARLMPGDRGLTEQPECDAAACIEENRKPEGEMIAAGEIKAPPGQP